MNSFSSELLFITVICLLFHTQFAFKPIRETRTLQCELKTLGVFPCSVKRVELSWCGVLIMWNGHCYDNDPYSKSSAACHSTSPFLLSLLERNSECTSYNTDNVTWFWYRSSATTFVRVLKNHHSPAYGSNSHGCVYTQCEFVWLDSIRIQLAFKLCPELIWNRIGIELDDRVNV